MYVFQMKKTILLGSSDETREISNKLNGNLKLYLNKGVNQVLFCFKSTSSGFQNILEK